MTHDTWIPCNQTPPFTIARFEHDIAAMRYLNNLLLSLSVCGPILEVSGNPSLQVPLTGSLSEANRNISFKLFADLEELSRIVDISYCVGTTGTGIQKPFLCASRCQDFPHFELVTVSTLGILYH